MTALRPSHSVLSRAATFLLTLGLAACDSAVPDIAEAPLADAKPTTLALPGEDPGPPFYANFFADFIPTDDGMVGISFVRDPACIPADFNLLTWLDLPTPPSPVHPPDPGAFACALTVEGRVWYDDPTPGSTPYQVQLSGGDVPIYFVDRAKLDGAMADNKLTITELQGLNPLVGRADRYRQVIHNSSQGSRLGHEVLNASGTLQGGRSFQFRYNERFDPGTGERTFRAVRIRFQ